MIQRLIETQNREIPDQEGIGGGGDEMQLNRCYGEAVQLSRLKNKWRMQFK